MRHATSMKTALWPRPGSGSGQRPDDRVGQIVGHTSGIQCSRLMTWDNKWLSNPAGALPGVLSSCSMVPVREAGSRGSFGEGKHSPCRTTLLHSGEHLRGIPRRLVGGRDPLCLMLFPLAAGLRASSRGLGVCRAAMAGGVRRACSGRRGATYAADYLGLLSPLAMGAFSSAHLTMPTERTLVSAVL